MDTSIGYLFISKLISRSPIGPFDSLQLSTRVFFNSSIVSSENYANSIDTFLKIISFCVSVPVLSERRNYIRPNSSGIVEFLAIVPVIPLSEEIQYE